MGNSPIKPPVPTCDTKPNHCPACGKIPIQVTTLNDGGTIVCNCGCCYHWHNINGKWMYAVGSPGPGLCDTCRPIVYNFDKN